MGWVPESFNTLHIGLTPLLEVYGSSFPKFISHPTNPPKSCSQVTIVHCLGYFSFLYSFLTFIICHFFLQLTQINMTFWAYLFNMNPIKDPIILPPIGSLHQVRSSRGISKCVEIRITQRIDMRNSELQIHSTWRVLYQSTSLNCQESKSF
jgi:hypothetical protein